MSVLLVDWLGRGGIAQSTETWAIELGGEAEPITIVTRAGRELGQAPAQVVVSGRGRGRIGKHRALVKTAVAAIREHRPTTVVIQNYVLPLIEGPVHRAAREVGARVIVVVHDHRLHSLAAGTRAGLRAQLRSADAVVAHSHFVAGAVSSYSGRSDIEVVPLPLFLGMLRSAPVPLPWPVPDGQLLAVHFGVLKRGYKGTSVVADLARQGVSGWVFGVLGAGAPDLPGVLAAPGYVESATLVAAVRRSAVTVLPYRLASQSGTVPLSQALESVPVASAVGGIPEQIDDGETGRLIQPGSSVDVWAAALEELADDGRRQQLAALGAQRAWARHREFVSAMKRLVE